MKTKKRKRRVRRGKPVNPGRPRQRQDYASSRKEVPNTCFREERISVRLVDPQPVKTGWEPYIHGAFPRSPASNGLVRFRLSEKWYPKILPKGDFSIPFIDHSGHIHALSLGTWRCSPVQLFATICSTVYKRLTNITRSQNRKKRCNLDCLFRASLYYTITNDDSFLRRCLSMLYRMDKNIQGFVYFKTKQMDANRRFLYDQVRVYSPLWFQSRVRVCERRVKSNNCDSSKAQPSGTHGVASLSTCLFNWDEWAAVYTAPNRLGLRRMIDSTVSRLFRVSSSYRG